MVKGYLQEVAQPGPQAAWEWVRDSYNNCDEVKTTWLTRCPWTFRRQTKCNEFCLVDYGDLGPYTWLNNPLGECDTDCACLCVWLCDCMHDGWLGLTVQPTSWGRWMGTAHLSRQTSSHHVEFESESAVFIRLMLESLDDFSLQMIHWSTASIWYLNFRNFSRL